jgi:hypothetical protein
MRIGRNPECADAGQLNLKTSVESAAFAEDIDYEALIQERHFTNLALVLSADDADSADKKWENLRQSAKSADQLVLTAGKTNQGHSQAVHQQMTALRGRGQPSPKLPRRRNSLHFELFFRCLMDWINNHKLLCLNDLNLFSDLFRRLAPALLM